MNTRPCLIALFCALVASKTFAQTKNDPPTVGAGDDTQAVQDGLKLRSEVAEAIANGSEKGDTALGRLRAHPSPSGLKADRDADFALAAMDLGHRLLVKGQGREAVRFFRAAEESLSALAEKTPDAKPAQKAFYLKQLALLRGNYLNGANQAKQDIDKAAALQPDDQQITQVKQLIGKEHGDVFKDAPTLRKSSGAQTK